MGKLARTGERAVLRAVWAGLSPVMGSSDKRYRQALWSRRVQEITGNTALSGQFVGVVGASGWYRRSWNQLGIVAVQGDEMLDLLNRPGARPAVAFRAGGSLIEPGGSLVVGELVGTNGFSRLVCPDGRPGEFAHGFRLGPDAAQFAMGVTVPPDGEFVTPRSDAVRTLGRYAIHQLEYYPDLANVSFS